MKSVNLLCAGPSLASARLEAADITIAVNSAAWLHRSDYVAFLDRHVLTGCESRDMLPREGWMTSPGMQVPKGVMRWGFALYNRRKEGELRGLLPEDFEVAIDQCNYTFPCALYEAQRLSEGGEIRLYGFDCAVGEDCVGGKELLRVARNNCDRSARRFRNELPWVRRSWGPNVVPLGRAPASVIEWLGAKNPGSLAKIFTGGN